MRVDQPGGLGQGDALAQPLVEELAQIPCDAPAGHRAHREVSGAQVPPQPLADERQAALRLERAARVREGGVQPADAGAQQRVGEVGVSTAGPTRPASRCVMSR